MDPDFGGSTSSGERPFGTPEQTAPAACRLWSGCDGGGFDGGRDAAIDAATPRVETQGRLVDLHIRASGVVADPARKRLYATVLGTAPAHANQLITIDVAQAKVIHGVPIGSEPSALAISQDGSTLWVYLGGAFAIRRVDLSRGLPVAEQQFALPLSPSGMPLAANGLLVLPGTTRSVVVLSSSGQGLVVLDDGVVRPGPSGMDARAFRALVPGPSGRLIGLGGGLEVATVTIGADGVGTTLHRGLVMSYDAAPTYANGYLFLSSGEVVDFSDATMPRRAGKFPMPGAVLLTPDHNQVLLFGARNLPQPSLGDSFSSFPRTFPVAALERIEVSTFTIRETKQVAREGLPSTSTSSFPPSLPPVRTVAQVDDDSAGILFGQSFDNASTLQLLVGFGVAELRDAGSPDAGVAADASALPSLSLDAGTP